MCFGGIAEAQQRGILGKRAPQWDVTQWIQLPEGTNALDVGNFKGKILYLYCFQSWCPGCHSSGFPTLKTLVDRYGEDEEVAFVAVQTVFEGHLSNTPKRGFDCAKRYNLEIPFGHSGSSGKASTVMRRYRTGGTPWTVIIDAKGTVRYNDFHIRPKQGVQMINALKAEIPVSKKYTTIQPGPVHAPKTKGTDG
jgi:thiol-disulfide isomerase/thioredoxin